MPLENLVGPSVYITALNRDWPLGTDEKREGDDHLRGIKNALQNSFPLLDGAVNYSAADINAGIAGGLGEPEPPGPTNPGPVPIGGIILWASNSTSYGTAWLLCDGTAISRTSYPDLFSAIGITYGPGNGSTTFNLPNLVDKAPEGGTPAQNGTTRGAETHLITEQQSGLRQHVHPATTTPTRSMVINEDATGKWDFYDYGSGREDDAQLVVNVGTNDTKDANEAIPIVGPRISLAYVIRVK